MQQPRIALVAALEREIRPLVADWKVRDQEHDGRKFRFFENGNLVLVCGGIGYQAAWRAAEAAFAFYQLEQLQSVGFAGALSPEMKVGDILVPEWVIDAKDGSRTAVADGKGVLVTFTAVAGAEQKRKLAQAYRALAVDMEAAAVARSAQMHGVGFSAIKAISDEVDFEMPDLSAFIGAQGNLRTGRFLTHAALRPWIWGRIAHLAGNSKKASESLCRKLAVSAADPENLHKSGHSVHQTK